MPAATWLARGGQASPPRVHAWPRAVAAFDAELPTHCGPQLPRRKCRASLVSVGAADRRRSPRVPTFAGTMCVDADVRFAAKPFTPRPARTSPLDPGATG